MKKVRLVYSRTEKLCETIEPEYYYEVWEKKVLPFRSRTNLYSRRHHREMQFERITRDSVAESLESFGSRDSIYNICEEEGRESFDGFSEDSDFDNTQSQRWRGG